MDPRQLIERYLEILETADFDRLDEVGFARRLRPCRAAVGNRVVEEILGSVSGAFATRGRPCTASLSTVIRSPCTGCRGPPDRAVPAPARPR